MLKRLPVFALASLSLVACASESDEDAVESGDSALAQMGEEPAGAASRHAIVLAHGFDASDTNGWSFYRLQEALERDGHLVVAARVSPYRGVPERATQLAPHVDAALEACAQRPSCDGSKVHIVAHSMGGLDARYLVAKLGYADKVASVTTISTPHRGSAVADLALRLTPGITDPVVDALASLWGRTFTDRDLAEGSSVRDALTSISEGHAESFNAEVPNQAGVFYQSWAGVSSPLERYLDRGERDACDGKILSYRNRHDRMINLQLKASAPVVGHLLTGYRPNDGMVTVESAKWGVFHGCIPADHLDEVGQPRREGPNWWSRFDHVRFYRTLVFGLDRAVAAHRGAGGPG